MGWNSKSNKQGLARSFFVACAICLAVVNLLAWFLPSPSNILWEDNPARLPGPCAIALYGLPRSFQSVVLPSLIKNVIQPNAVYRCDYFVYYHNTDHDSGGRDDRSGAVDGNQVILLHDAVQTYHTPPYPSVTIESFTDDEFWKSRSKLVRKIHAEKDSLGRPIYIPYKHESYYNTTIENIVKMWHAQEAVWSLLDDTVDSVLENPTRKPKKHYSRVGMLRLDVVYITPIHMYQLPNKSMDFDNSVAVIPNFARHPVNDRLIIGPFEAVQVWAAERVRRLPQHGRFISQHASGDGIHSERFLNYTIFPAIRQRGITILNHPDMCFLRARADASLRFSDCGMRHTTKNNLQAVQTVLDRPCQLNMTHVNRSIVLLECADNLALSNAHSMRHTSWHQGCFTDEQLPPKLRKKVGPCMDPHISIFKRYRNDVESIVWENVTLL